MLYRVQIAIGMKKLTPKQKELMKSLSEGWYCSRWEGKGFVPYITFRVNTKVENRKEVSQRTINELVRKEILEDRIWNSPLGNVCHCYVLTRIGKAIYKQYVKDK